MLFVPKKLTIGEMICAARKRCGLSQEDLANRMGLSKNTIYAYENERIQPPEKRMDELCIVLGCPLGSLKPDGWRRKKPKRAQKAKKRKPRKTYKLGYRPRRKKWTRRSENERKEGEEGASRGPSAGADVLQPDLDKGC